MRRTPIVLCVVLAVSFLCGCVAPSYSRVYETYPPTSPSAIEILRSKPAHDFVLIADTQMHGPSENQVRKWAAGVGADAVIITVTRVDSTTSAVFSTIGNEVDFVALSRGNKQVFASAIQLKSTK
jgi:hypothetical protein